MHGIYLPDASDIWCVHTFCGPATAIQLTCIVPPVLKASYNILSNLEIRVIRSRHYRQTGRHAIEGHKKTENPWAL